MALVQAHQQGHPQERAHSTLAALPDGPMGTRVTLKLMGDWTKQYRTNPRVRALAERLIAAVPEKHHLDETAAIQRWVRDAVRYTMDVRDVETLKTPLVLLDSMQGDCDDKALLAGALLESIGHKVRYVAVSLNDPAQFDHVYLEDRIGPRWVPVETTEQVEIGWAPPADEVKSTMVWHV